MRRPRLSARRLLLIGVFVIILAALVYVASQPSDIQPATKPTVTFDFDTGYPPLVETQTTPLNQTSNGITAYFSSPSDTSVAPAFSVQSYDTTFTKLSQFSGKYLYDNNPTRDILDIKFSTEIIAIKVTFATVELQDGAVTEPSDILLTAYENTNLIGTTTAYGSFSSDSYPQGTLSLNPGQLFNWVRIAIPAETPTTDFLIDNITVTAISTSTT